MWADGRARPRAAGAAQKPHCGGDDGRTFKRWGKRMRAVLAVVTVAALVALTASAQAQGMGLGMSGANGTGKDVERREGGAPPPKEKPSKPANEKEYKSSLDRLPNQKYDPWAKTR
jgi:hypothetical protein